MSAKWMNEWKNKLETLLLNSVFYINNNHDEMKGVNESIYELVNFLLYGNYDIVYFFIVVFLATTVFSVNILILEMSINNFRDIK